jgi:hypothetical protein
MGERRLFGAALLRSQKPKQWNFPQITKALFWADGLKTLFWLDQSLHLEMALLTGQGWS